MSVIAVTSRLTATMVLSAGTDPVSGKSITKNVSLTGLRGGAEPEKIMNVVALAAPCLAYPVARVQTTEVKSLEQM